MTLIDIRWTRRYVLNVQKRRGFCFYIVMNCHKKSVVPNKYLHNDAIVAVIVNEKSFRMCKKLEML